MSTNANIPRNRSGDLTKLRLEGFDTAGFALTEKEICHLSNLKVPLPKNEIERIKVLRETKLLDSARDKDEEYDRFTNLSQRIFNVPISLISLIDIHRQWFKSHVGLSINETERDAAFCAYVILEDCSEVMVVPDALQDPRFKENRLVIGYPFIRFYAGCALIINGVKLGALCIIDDKPRHDFDDIQQLNLKDIASMVAELIKWRRNSYLETEMKMAKLLMSIVYSLKYPLRNVTDAFEEIQTTTQFNELFHMKLNSLKNYIASLVKTTETVLNIALATVEPSPSMRKQDNISNCIIPKECQVIQILGRDYQNVSNRRYGMNKFSLNLDTSSNALQNERMMTISYPQLITLAFVTILDDLVDTWINIDIKLAYECKSDELNHFSNKWLNLGFQEKGSTVIFGDILIDIHCSSIVPSVHNPTDDLESQQAGNVFMKFVTNFVGGSYIQKMEDSKYSLLSSSSMNEPTSLHSFTFPCYSMYKKTTTNSSVKPPPSPMKYVFDPKELLKSALQDSDSELDLEDIIVPLQKMSSERIIMSADPIKKESSRRVVSEISRNHSDVRKSELMKPTNHSKFALLARNNDDEEEMRAIVSVQGKDLFDIRTNNPSVTENNSSFDTTNSTLNIMNYVPSMATRIYPYHSTVPRSDRRRTNETVPPVNDKIKSNKK